MFSLGDDVRLWWRDLRTGHRAMAQKSIEERVSLLEAELAGKSLEMHFREQAELLDVRFDESFRSQAELIDKLFAYRFGHLDNKWGPRFTVIERRVSNVQSDTTALKTDVTALKTDVTTLKADVATLQTDVATLKTDVATLKADAT